MNFIFFFFVSVLLFSCDHKAEDINIPPIEEPKEPEDSDFAYKQYIISILNCMNMPRPKDSYNYPVYPGMPEWADLKSNKEMLEVSQVPVEILKTMSTQAVIQAIWEYQDLIFIVHRYQYQADFEQTFSQNNAYTELCSRTDAGQCLLTRLVLLNPVHSNIIVRWTCQSFEIIVSQPVFLSQLGEDEKKLIIKTTLKNDDLRQKMDPSRKVSNRNTAWLLIGKTMLNANYIPFIKEVEGNELLQSFFKAYSYVSFEVLHYDTIPLLIGKYAEDFLIN